jgi:hypothetical protein
MRDDAMATAIVRLSSMTLTKAFACWLERCRSKARQRKTVRNIILRMQNQLLDAAFGAWADAARQAEIDKMQGRLSAIRSVAESHAKAEEMHQAKAQAAWHRVRGASMLVALAPLSNQVESEPEPESRLEPGIEAPLSAQPAHDAVAVAVAAKHVSKGEACMASGDHIGALAAYDAAIASVITHDVALAADYRQRREEAMQAAKESMLQQHRSPRSA